jgi:transcriptional regulator with XRE-family HTH domain
MTKKSVSKKMPSFQNNDKSVELSDPFLMDPREDDATVGQRLREIRSLQGLSLRALAELSGLNINTLSLIENEHTSPSVSTLQQLAQSLQVSITEFFQTERGSKRLVHQKHGNRPRLAFKRSAMEDLAPGMPRFGMEPILVTLEPGADSGKSPIVHTGREFVFCLDGNVAYKVDNRTYLLTPGDSLIFEAYLPHQWKNIDPMPSRVLLVLSPLDERDQPRERHFSR